MEETYLVRIGDWKKTVDAERIGYSRNKEYVFTGFCLTLQLLVLGIWEPLDCWKRKARWLTPLWEEIGHAKRPKEGADRWGDQVEDDW